LQIEKEEEREKRAIQRIKTLWVRARRQYSELSAKEKESKMASISSNTILILMELIPNFII